VRTVDLVVLGLCFRTSELQSFLGARTCLRFTILLNFVRVSKLYRSSLLCSQKYLDPTQLYCGSSYQLHSIDI